MISTAAMHHFKLICLIIALGIIPCIVQAQQPKASELTSYVGGHLVVPASIRESCTWSYAIVKVNTNAAGKITGYDCLNEVDTALKRNLGFLNSYKFSDKGNIKGRSVIFFVSFDYPDTCHPKSNDYLYRPNEVITIISRTLYQLRRDYPTAIIVTNPVISTSMPPIR